MDFKAMVPTPNTMLGALAISTLKANIAGLSAEIIVMISGTRLAINLLAQLHTNASVMAALNVKILLIHVSQWIPGITYNLNTFHILILSAEKGAYRPLFVRNHLLFKKTELAVPIAPLIA